MKLLIVTTDYPPKSGGIATYGFQLARALSTDHDVTVLATGLDEKRDREQAFATVRLPGPSFLQHLFLTWKLLMLLKQGKFDAALHTTWPTAVIGYLFRRDTHPPYFVSAHASEILDDRLSWRRRIKMAFRPLKIRTLHRAAGLFPVSHYTAGLLQRMGLGDVPIQVINNGVDPKQFIQVDRSGFFSPPRLLTVARLDRHKGHDVVLQALARLIGKGTPVIYRIVGSGGEEKYLKNLAIELGIQKSVEFMGFVPEADLPGIYAESDIFIMLSREIPGRLDIIEGFGISFLEASAAGLPVIAGNSGGVSDAVIDGKTGLLVVPEDVELVERTLTTLLSDADRAIAMGRSGREWVENEMRWENVASRIALAMKEMVSL